MEMTDARIGAKSDEMIIEEAVQAIRDSDYDWRTIEGIAQALNEDPQKVATVIVNSPKFIRNSRSTSSGEPLYGVRKDYSAHTPLLEKITSVVAGRVL